jgi:hypothetical protein
VGYALERARGNEATSEDEPRARKPRASRRSDAAKPWPTADDLITSGTVALVGKLLDAWRPARKASFTRLLRAGAAGAGAALLLELVKPLLRGRAELPTLDQATGRRMLAGAGQGLLYGAVVEPRVPGPAVFKGAVFALAEYMADPAGGLSHLLGAHAPHARLPVVADLLDRVEREDREYLDQLVFAVALAVLCGDAPSPNGVVAVED